MDMEYKLYSPLSADFIPVDEFGPTDSDVETLEGYELICHQEAIQKAVDFRNSGGWDGNIMQYYDNQDGLAQKVVRAEIGISVREGELQGCTTVTVKEPLTADELSSLKDYLTGQYSDGWGEGFEQQDISIEGGVLNVYFWYNGNFSFDVEAPELPAATTKQETRPKMNLSGHDGNIFAILARANKLLNGVGQRPQALEMVQRVLDCDSYNKALRIVSEYVETELTPHLANPKKPGRKEVR